MTSEVELDFVSNLVFLFLSQSNQAGSTASIAALVALTTVSASV